MKIVNPYRNNMKSLKLKIMLLILIKGFSNVGSLLLLYNNFCDYCQLDVIITKTSNKSLPV